MRRIMLAVIMLLTFAVPVAIANEKVTICHVPAGNPENAHTITISENALKAHLGENEVGLHGGDYFGECVVDTLTPSPEPFVSTTPEPTVEPTPETPVVDLPDTAMDK